MVGDVGVGGANPIRVQSMITCDTMDTEASHRADARAGGGRLRDRAHHRADGEGRGQSASTSCADCASAAATCRSWPTFISNPKPRWKRRSGSRKSGSIPGNYADSKKFKIIEYTDEQYAAELERIRERFTPLVRLCKERGIAHAHRHEPRLAQRPHHEPLRRHAARDGGERARVRPHRARSRLSRLHFLDEVEQPEGDDRRPIGCSSRGCARKGRIGIIRFISA